MIRKRFKKSLSLILAIVLTLGLCPLSGISASAADSYNDTSGHWAESAIERWSDYSVLSGYNGAFRPNDPITRAEMATVLTKVVGYTAVGANPFADVDSGKWYYEAVLKLATAGIMRGSNGKARPEDNITREEAAALIVRAFEIPEKADDPNPFKDAGSISSWAAGSVGGLHTAGYILGEPGEIFDPKASITRAEVVTIIDNFIKDFYNEPGEFSSNVSGNAVIRADGITLKDSKISGNLYLTEGIGDGDAALDNVTVTGTTYIRGGGKNSINVTGGALEVVELNSLTETHLALSSDTKVTKISIIKTGTVTHGDITVAFDAATGTLTLGGTIDKVLLNADGTMTVTAGGITYEITPPEDKITTLALTKGSAVKEMDLNAPLHITGTGQIDKLSVHVSGSVIDSGVDVQLANITVNKGITVTVGGKVYTGTGGVLTAGDSGGGSGGGGSDVGNTVTVSYETFGEPKIEPSIITKGSTLSAIPQPVRAEDAFTGWYTDSGFIEPFDAAQPIDKNMTLYADWTERDNNYQEYSEANKFIDDCGPRYAVTVLSPTIELTAANLADYALIEGTGQIPAFTVTGLGDGRYLITPQTDYEAGCMYTFSLQDNSLKFDNEDAGVRNLTIRIFKAETKVIDFQDGIIDVDWDDVSDYSADEDTGLGSMKVPALKYSAVKETFLLNSADPEATTTIRIKDFVYGAGDENYRETEYRNITGLTEADGVLTLETENSQLIDVFEELEVYLSNIEIDLDDYLAGLDLDAVAAQAAQSAGARQMGELLNASLAESPTIQGLLAEPTTLAVGLPSSADYGFKTPSRENEENLLPGAFNMFLELVNVKATTGETDNVNFGDGYRPGYFVTVEFSYSGTIKNKVQVDATFKVTEYMSLYAGLDAKYKGKWNKPKTWDDLEITFLTNIFSQTDITVDVIAKSVSKDPDYAYEIDVSQELTKLMNGDEDQSEGAAVMLKKVLADQGDYVDIISLPIFKATIEIIPEAPVIEVEVELDFVIKASFAAGVHTDMTFLGARALGFYYNLDNGEKITYNLPFENYDNQYYIDLWAAGYFGVKAGLKGEVSVGVIGLKYIFDAGMSLELGAYADMWGLIHLTHYRHRHPYYKGTDVQGGMYFEVGIYLEMDIFVRSKLFGAKTDWKFVDQKWPLFTFGDRYLLLRFVNNNSRILMRGDLLLTGGAGLFDAEFIDLKTGNIVKGGEYANPGNFSVAIPSPYFETDRTAGKIKIRADKFGNYAYTPYVAAGTKTISTPAIVYYRGGSLAFGSHTVVPSGYEDLMYSQKGITLIWADPSLDVSGINDLKSYKASYYLEMDGQSTLLDSREVLVGQVPGAPVLPIGKWQEANWKHYIEWLNQCIVKGVSPDFGSVITKDTDYIITAEKLQRLEAIVTHHDGSWHFDVYAVNSGEYPILPQGYDTNFGGWTTPVNWYIETGYPAITATALHELQPAGGKYEVFQTEGGGAGASYRPDLAYVSGYPTDRPIYSYTSQEPEDYPEYGSFNNYSARAYVHKWAAVPSGLLPSMGVGGSWSHWYQDGDGNWQNYYDWTRYYEYLYVANYSQQKYTATFNAGVNGEFADFMEEYLDSYGRYSNIYPVGTAMNTLYASAVVPPTDSENTYHLSGWKDQDGNEYQPGEQFKVTKDLTFTALYEAAPDVYTITIYPAGATFPDGSGHKTFTGGYGVSANIGATLTFDLLDGWTASAGAGYDYVFDGWYYGSGAKLTAWPATFGELGKDAGNIVIVAKIKRVTQLYTITFNANGGAFPGGGETYAKAYEYGATINPADIPTPTRAEDAYFTYTFAGWGTLQPVIQNDSYFAVWAKTLKDMPLPSGIFISDGVTTEDINSVNLGVGEVSGYAYAPDNDNIPTLTITGNGLTVSGEVAGAISGPEDTVQIIIDENVTDVTFKDLSLTGLYEYSNIVYSYGSDLLKITIAGDCSIEKDNGDRESSARRSAIYSYRDLLLQGADESARLSITAERAHGISVYGDLTIEGLNLTMDVSGVIEELDVNGDGALMVPIMAQAFSSDGGSRLSFIDANMTISSPGSMIYGGLVIAGSGHFEYVSTDDNPALIIGGSLSFEDFTGIFSACFENTVAKPVVIAVEGIGFTVDGSAADSADYGANVALCDDEITDGWNYDFGGVAGEPYYTFVDNGGDPIAEVTVQRQ